MQEFRNRVAVITGGASGIGYAMAERFAREGMQLMLADIEAESLERAAQMLRGQGGPVSTLVTDVTKEAEVNALAEATYREFGAVHILCNNAGVISEGAPVWEESARNWEWVLGVNFYGVLHGVRAFTPRMLAQAEEAHIVNTASLAGLVSRPLMSAYNASKYAVVALSECLYAELQLTPKRIPVSVLCPMFAKTRLADARRNRPGGGQEELTASYGFFDALKQVVEEGKPPQEIAEHVLQAVKEERFWILPHTEGDASLRTRLDQILARGNPPVRDMRSAPVPLG